MHYQWVLDIAILYVKERKAEFYYGDVNGMVRFLSGSVNQILPLNIFHDR